MNDLHFAVVVGIDFYPGIRNLSSARNDARAFCAWLADPGGGELPPPPPGQPPQNSPNIELILEPGPFAAAADARPTRDIVSKAFKKIHTRMRQVYQANPLDWERSRLYVYFSGHGVTPSPQEVAVLMADATEDDLGYNIACGLYLNYYLASQDFHELVFLTDCCRSFKGTAPLSPPPFSIVNNHRGAVASAMGYATQYQDVAYEPSMNGDDGRGYYTKALLEGLGGAAVDPDVPGEINSTSLQNYVRKRVTEMTKDKAVPQIPEMAAPGAKVVFRTGAQRPRRQITIHFPAGFARRVMLSDGKLAKVGEWDPAQGDWVQPLDDGNYEVRPLDAADGHEFAKDGLFKVVGEDRRVDL